MLAKQVSYQVHELFHSIQGEGVQAGQSAIFIRLQGCPVGCSWCDAKLTWYAGGRAMTLDDIAATINGLRASRWFVVTGGEPLLYDLDPLIELLKGMRPRTKIQIETSGWFQFKGSLRPDWLTVSPKYTKHYKVALNVMQATNELKYVVDEHFTPNVVIHQVRATMASRTQGPPLISLMPEGSPPRPEMVDRTLEILHRYPLWRFSPRLQYSYPAIAAMEGDTNDGSLTRDDARAASAAHHAPIKEIEVGA